MARPQPKPDFLKVKKLFVGGLSNATTEEVLKKYFGQLGTITSFDQPVDPDTKKKRGFCFITFDSEDAVNEAMKSQYHYIGEEQARVEVKRAQNKGDKDQSGGGGGGYGYQAQQRAGQTGYWGEWGQGYNQGTYDQTAAAAAYGQYQYGQGYYGQYPTAQYPNYYGQPYYDQTGYYNYNQAAGYQYGQTGGYDYTQAYSQGYTGGNE